MVTLCRDYGVEHRFTAPYHANPSKAERAMQVLKQMLQAYVFDLQNTWDEKVKSFAFAINTTVTTQLKVPQHILLWEGKFQPHSTGK